MPINPDQAIAAELPAAEFCWTSSDIQLHQLGLARAAIRWARANFAT